MKIDLMHMEATEEDIRHPGSGANLGDLRNVKQRHKYEDDEWIRNNFKCSSSRTYKLNHLVSML